MKKRDQSAADSSELHKGQVVEDDEGGGQGGDEPGKTQDDAGDDEDDEDDDGEDEEDSVKKCGKAEKSLDLTKDDLEKSLGQLESYVADQDKPTRKAQLLEKAQAGELSKSERDELYQILGGAEEPKSALGTELTKGLVDNEGLAKALDVSDYLQEQHTELCKALETLGGHVEQSDQRQHEFNLLLAKAVSDIGALTKSVHERLEAIEGQPARGPKSRGLPQTQPLEKSFAGRAADAGGEFSKSEALDAMQELLVKSVDSGQGGMVEGVGDMGVAISKFEQFNTMSPATHARVAEHLRQRAAH